ncbi:hypothetical protein ACTXT7_014028 [Hymenolepis weldensis]
MGIKLEKATNKKKGKSKSKDAKGSKSLPKRKKDSKTASDLVEREAARSKALEARIYFQRADLSKKEIELQQTHELRRQAEEFLKSFTDTAEEASAFTTWQHEHSLERLTDRINELTIANTKLKDERNDLQSKLEASIEEANATLAAKEAEIAKLNNLIKESHYKYERVFGLFADRLVEKLTEKINQLQTQSYASTLVSGAIEKGSTISDSDQQLTEILLSPSTDAEIQMIDRLIESPELFPTLPSEKQAFVLYWIMFICEFLHRDIEKGTFPSGIIQNFEVNGRNYGEYRTDLQYMLHAVNSEFPGVLQIYLENINSYLEKEYK